MAGLRASKRNPKSTCIHTGIRGTGAAMCDEYDDARMKAFWRALGAIEAENELEDDKDELLRSPVSVATVEPPKPKAKSLLR